jgi:signal transduction histidine kinase
MVADVSSRHRAEHQAVLTISRLALSPVSQRDLLQGAAEAVAHGVGAPLVAIALGTPGAALSIVAAVGWRRTLVGTTLEAPREPTDEPNDLAAPSMAVGLHAVEEGRRVLVEHGATDHLGIPLTVRGAVTGFISLHHTNDDGFSDDDRVFTLAVAHIIGLAIERRKMLAELSLSEAHLTMLLTQLPGVVWVTNADLVLTLVTGSGLETLHLTAEELVGVPLSEIYVGARDAPWLAAHRRVLTGESVTIEGPFMTGMWSLRLEPLRSETGKVTGVVAVAVEVSEIAAARREAQARLAALERIDDERRRLLTELTSVAEAERRRLSREIHDDVGQLLTSVSLHTAALASEQPRNDTVVKLQHLVADAQRSLRELVTSIRDATPGGVDLTEALRSLAADLEGHGVRVDVHGAGLSTPLPGDIAAAAYRIAQESLTNAIRHAGATAVSITVTRLSDHLSVVTEDDGIGFDPEIAYPGHGLRSMRERAADARGSLMIESGPETGTSVHFDVPVHRERR